MHASSAEFKLIQTFFQRAAQQQKNDSAVRLGIGDDCAIFTPALNTELAISVDTSIANIHFPDNASAGQIAARALNVALSDLAAMGAKPVAFTLALSLPKHFNTYQENTREAFLNSFSQGLFRTAKQASVSLIGGDTTQGDMPLSVSVTVYGELPKGKGLERGGAKLGDTIYLSRSTGEAGAGLALWLAGERSPTALIEAYINPQPELALGQELLTVAHSCIDVSDGLLSDLQHILSASLVHAVIDCDKLLNSSALEIHCGKVKALKYALTAGDDYCLCLTAKLTRQQSESLGLIAIGEITEANDSHPMVRLINKPEQLLLKGNGYDHFE